MRLDPPRLRAIAAFDPASVPRPASIAVEWDGVPQARRWIRPLVRQRPIESAGR